MPTPTRNTAAAAAAAFSTQSSTAHNSTNAVAEGSAAQSTNTTASPEPTATSSVPATASDHGSTVAASSTDTSSNIAANSSSSSSGNGNGQSWWQRHQRGDIPLPPRFTAAWWREMILICFIFGVTGTSSMFLVRPLVEKIFNLKGSMKEGPWSYRLISMATLMPSYSIMLVFYGTLAGRHHYFKRVAMRMWGRFLPKKWRGIQSTAAAPTTAASQSRAAQTVTTQGKKHN